MNRKLSFTLALLLVMPVMFAGLAPWAAGTKEAAAAPARTDLKLAVDIPMSTLDPTAIRSPGTVMVFRSMFETLVDVGADLKPVPALAESWTTSADGLVFTFKIRQGVKFHNGEDLNADDVLFTFNRFFAEPIGRYYAYYLGKVEKVDDWTIRITTPAIFDGIFSTLASYLFIVPKDYTESMKNDLSAKPVGCGPYKLVEFVSGSHVKMTASETYYKGQPAIKDLVFKFIPDISTRSIALESSEVDLITDSSIEDRTRFMTSSTLAYAETMSFFGYSMVLNPKVGPMKDAKLREAIIAAIDKKSILTSITNGIGQVTDCPISPIAYPAYTAVKFGGYNLERAKAALAASSYNTTKETLVITTLDPLTTKIAEVVQYQLSLLGVATRVETIEVGVYYQRVAQGLIQMSIGFGGGAIFGPQQSLGGFTKAQDPGNRWPRSDEIESIYAALLKAPNPAERVALIKQSDTILNGWHILNPLYVTVGSVTYTKGLKGVQVHPEGRYLLNTLSW